MNIDPIIDHQAWIDKDILSSRAEPDLDDFDSLQGIFFLVKGRLFLARSLNQGSQFWVRWTVNLSRYHFLVFTGHCILLLVPYYHIKFSTYLTRIRSTFYNRSSDCHHILSKRIRVTIPSGSVISNWLDVSHLIGASTSCARWAIVNSSSLCATSMT